MRTTFALPHRWIGTLFAICGIAVLAGCVPTQQPRGPVAIRWERPNAARDDFPADVAKCDYEVSAVVPPAVYHPFATNMWVLLQDQINISDTEARLRGLMEKCLVAKGWTKVGIFADGTTTRPATVNFEPRKLQ